MVKLLRALGAAVSAFADELWPFDFPVLRDPGEALEDEIVSKGVFAEEDNWCNSCEGPCLVQSTSGDDAAGAGNAPSEVSPTSDDLPRSSEVGHPIETVDDAMLFWMAAHVIDIYTTGDMPSYWNDLAPRLRDASRALR